MAMKRVFGTNFAHLEEHDEPASVLLERIRSVRTAKELEGPKRRTLLRRA